VQLVVNAAWSWIFFAWRRGLRDSHLPLVVAGLLILGFAVGPVFGLPLIGRYMRTPATLLIVYYALACAGFTLLAPSRERFRWGLVGASPSRRSSSGSRHGGMRRVQLLGVGGGAQELPEARRLRSRGAEGVAHLLRIQPQEIAHGRGRGHRACGAGGVEHLIVRAA
jgi:hypothetical protein